MRLLRGVLLTSALVLGSCELVTESETRSSSGEPFLVRNELINFDAVFESCFGLPSPGFGGREPGPMIEGRVQLDRIVRALIMREPLAGRDILRINGSFPMPVKPTGAAYADGIERGLDGLAQQLALANA